MNEQKQEQKKQDDAKKQNGQSQPKKDESEPKDPSQPKEPNEPKDGQNKDSAFGDMKNREQPPSPPPTGDTQKVGGPPKKPEGEQPPVDPSLALPLQKLDQLRNQDSPAELFKLMEGEKAPAPRKKTKDW